MPRAPNPGRYKRLTDHQVVNWLRQRAAGTNPGGLPPTPEQAAALTAAVDAVAATRALQSYQPHGRPYRPDLSTTATPAALQLPAQRQWQLVAHFTAAALQAGLVPRDAVARGIDVVETLRLYLRDPNTAPPLNDEDVAYLQHLALGACRTPTPETGYTLAHRAIESWRLLREWRDGRRRYQRRPKLDQLQGTAAVTPMPATVRDDLLVEIAGERREQADHEQRWTDQQTVVGWAERELLAGEGLVDGDGGGSGPTY